MPTSADNLTVSSSKEATQAAVSDCVAQTMRENPNMEQKQAVAICMEKSRRATGHGASKAE